MIQILRKIITNVLIALYQPFGFALILAILFMFLYMYAEEQGWKGLVQKWIKVFKTNASFRRLFLFAFYTAMILFRTLLNRSLDLSTVYDVIGVWGLYTPYGDLTTEVIENTILFIPFVILLFWGFGERIWGQQRKFLSIIGKGVQIVFLFSVTIEFLQLFLRLGHFQLSDLFYNTLGGFIGSLLYWCGHKITIKKRGKGCDEK